MRLIILGSAEGLYARDLLRAATSFADRLDESIVIGFDQLEGRLAPDGSVAVYAEGRAIDADDLVLVRTMPLGTLEQVIFRMNLLHLLQQQGVRVVNSARTLEIAIDKWLTLTALRDVGVQIPKTICCQTREQAIEGFELLGRDVVVKPIFGSEGRGILRVDDIDMAWRVFGTLDQLRQIIYLQGFVPHHGYDLRLLVLDQEVLAVKRSSNTDWRTNLSRGAVAEPYQPTEQQLKVARKAAAAVGGFVLGVDLLPGVDGQDYLLEVNAVPGWKGTGAALGIDIAHRLLDILLR